MSRKEQVTMEFEIDLHDDNLTVIGKQIELLGRQVRETGDPEAQEQLAVAYRNYGFLRAQELAMSVSVVPLLLAGKSISPEVRQALRESRLKDAAALVMQQYGLNCLEAGQLLDVSAC